jgi:hypothetical protein
VFHGQHKRREHFSSPINVLIIKTKKIQTKSAVLGNRAGAGGRWQWLEDRRQVGWAVMGLYYYAHTHVYNVYNMYKKRRRRRRRRRERENNKRSGALWGAFFSLFYFMGELSEL